MLLTFLAVVTILLVIGKGLVFYILWDLRAQVAEISRRLNTELVTQTLRDNERMSYVEDRQQWIERHHLILKTRVDALIGKGAQVRVHVEHEGRDEIVRDET